MYEWRTRIVAKGLYQKGLTHYSAMKTARSWIFSISEWWPKFQPQEIIDGLYMHFVSRIIKCKPEQVEMWYN